MQVRIAIGAAIAAAGLIIAPLVSATPAVADDSANITISPKTVSLPADGSFCKTIYLNYVVSTESPDDSWTLEDWNDVSVFEYGYGSTSSLMDVFACDTFSGGVQNFLAEFTVWDEELQVTVDNLVRIPITFVQSTTSSVKLSKTSQVYGSTSASVTVSTNSRAGGTATIYDGSRKLGTSKLVKGKATYTLPKTLAPGKHSIKAVFHGSAYFTKSTSKPVTLTVNPIATKTSVKLSKSTQTYASNSVAKLNVTTTRVPGKFTIYDGTKTLGTRSITSGKSTVALPRTLKRGTHSLKVKFTPTSKLYKASTSTTVKLKVR